ncbi:MAG: glutamate racemase [Clostridia bacterium]
MDNRPIGVFDSGLGGLTAVRQIKKILPFEDIIYLGDTGRVPYGTRSKETIIKYTKQDINFLLSHNIKAIVVACGTASSVALKEVENDYSVPIVGVVEPTVLASINGNINQKIGIIGTTSTIKSGAYSRLIKEISDEKSLNIQTFEKDCPLFVPLVENGRFLRGDAVTKLVVEEYLTDIKNENIDTLILGCTHYPLLKELIADFLGENVKLIDPGAVTAEYIAKNFDKSEEKKANYNYYVTDDVESFTKNAKSFLCEEINDKTHMIDILEY